jgi:hypothetical protein
MKSVKEFFKSLYEAICAARMARAEAFVRGQRGS